MKKIILFVMCFICLIGCKKKSENKQKENSPIKTPQSIILNTANRQLKNKRYTTAINTFKELYEKYPNKKNKNLIQKAIAIKDSANNISILKNFKKIILKNPQSNIINFIKSNFLNNKIPFKGITFKPSLNPNKYLVNIKCKASEKQCINLMKILQTSGYAVNISKFRLFKTGNFKPKNNIFSLTASLEFYIFSAKTKISSQNLINLASFLQNIFIISDFLNDLNSLNLTNTKPFNINKTKNFIHISFLSKDENNVYFSKNLKNSIKNSMLYYNFAKDIDILQVNKTIINYTNFTTSEISLKLKKNKKIDNLNIARKTIKNKMQKIISHRINFSGDILNPYFTEMKKYKWFKDFRKNVKIAAVTTPINGKNTAYIKYKNKKIIALNEGDKLNDVTLVLITHRKIKFAKDGLHLDIWVPKSIREEKTGQNK